MLIRRLLSVLAVLLLVSGCIPVQLVANRDPGYSGRLTSVVIWESGSLQDKYPMLKDRMSRLSTALAMEFQHQGIRTATLTTKSLDLNSNDTVRSEVQRVDAKQILHLQPSSALVRTSVDFYDVDLVIIDGATRREVWKGTLRANFYSEPDEMVEKLISQLREDRLL